MIPYCFICRTEDPVPVEIEDGFAHWFIFSDYEYDDFIELVVNENDELVEMYSMIKEKDFDHDEKDKIICPECAQKDLDQRDE